MLTFLGGVRDVEAARGFLPVAPDTIVAVDLSAGTVLWRRDGIGRPLAATKTRLVTLVAAGTTFSLRLFDVMTGEDAGQVAQLGLPDWADGGTGPESVRVTASETASGILLDWRVRRPYRGGASPSAEVLTASQDEATGRLLVTPDSAQATAVGAEAASPSRPGDAAAVEAPITSDDKSVVALDRIGDRLFTLRVIGQGPTRVVVLEAQDAVSGARWEAQLATQPASRPGPLRK